MKRLKMMTSLVLFGMALMLMLSVPFSALAGEQENPGTAPRPAVSIPEKSPYNDPYIRAVPESTKGADFSIWASYTVLNSQENPDKPQCIASVSPGSSAVIKDVKQNDWRYGGTVNVTVAGADYGRLDVTIQIEDKSTVITVVTLPVWDTIEEVSLAGYQKVNVKWKAYNGMSGYLVQRSLPDANDYQTVGTFPATELQGTVPAPLGVMYQYRVVPFVSYEGSPVVSEYGRWKALSFRAGIPGTLLRSVSVKGAVITLEWNEMEGAERYDICRAGSDNGSYKKIASVKGVTKWSEKVGKGKVYCYKVNAVFPEGGTGESNSLSQFIREKKKETVTEIKKTNAESSSEGQYGWNWASPDTIGYYVSGKTLYIVCSNGSRTIKIYGLDEKEKVVSKKKVKLPEKYDIFGGFYHGEDNRNYVAVGYNNPKESKTKTVIKVYQYDKNWKRLKTAEIKGEASNLFAGIYKPFDAASTSFALQGHILYLFTGRLMFESSDKLHHQSNISFRIDTRTMEVVTANESYASHSFNQRARFKDGSLYLMDHGDAYPRAIKLTSVTNFGNTENSEKKSWNAFEFQGQTGSNYTGCEVAGMEVGAGNILTVGTALPHYYAVKGKTGMNSKWEKNLFVAVSNRSTGKTEVKWITNFSPARKKNVLGEARLVKISDYRFAILVTIDDVLNYYAINQNGKTVAHVVYKKVPFTASTQPVLYGGMITWRENASAGETQYNKKKKKWETVGKRPAVLCRIPVK